MQLGYGNAMSVGISLLGILFVVISQLAVPRRSRAGGAA